ncbi:hypothetical protein GGI07_001364 [Coemansia sp. Benny D115]|nr:hypothetical protein GGI07_001364 [Coemansia sp. Benny D115]
MPYYTPTSVTTSAPPPLSADSALSPGLGFASSQQQPQSSMQAYFGQWTPAHVPAQMQTGHVVHQPGISSSMSSAPLHAAMSQVTPTTDTAHALSSPPVSITMQGIHTGSYTYTQQQQQQQHPMSASSLFDLSTVNNSQQPLFSGHIGSATTDANGIPNIGQPGTSSTPGVETDYQGVRLVTSNQQQAPPSSGFPGEGLLFTEFVQHFMPLTVPPPVPPLLQQYQSESQSGGQGQGHNPSQQLGINSSRNPPFHNSSRVLNQTQPHSQPQSQPHLQTQPQPDIIDTARLPHATEKDALSSTLGNVAIAMTKHDVDSASVQTTLDHLSYVTKTISYASHDAFTQAKEAAAEAVASIISTHVDSRAECDESRDGFIHESLLRMERRAELAGKAVHNYFCYIHPQCPIIHKPTFLRQAADGSVNHFVWLSLRALSARTLLHSHTLTESEVLIEEEYFATKAQMTLSAALSRPSVEIVQGLALLSLYIFGTPRWQEASMYWCKATRLAQLMEYHVIDAPTRAIATKMHFGIFEPPKRGTVHREDLALIPEDFSGQHVPLAQALTPLEAELRRRLWWTLFTNERFCSIAERLPTMVNETRMFVHFPCSAREWDQPEFTYQAPARVPRFLREGYTRAELGDDLNSLTLGQEMKARKADNLYLMCEIEYGFSMSHLVAFLTDMGSLFRPRSPYGNDYIPMFMQISWSNKMKMLKANVERVERIFEMVRQDILQRLALVPAQEPSTSASNRWTQSTLSPHATAAGGDPVLDRESYVPGIEIPHLHQLSMLILYSVLNIHLYRMVFQLHYEFSSSLTEPSKRRHEDTELLSAFDQYVKELWIRSTTAAQQVSRILRGEFPGVPHWVLTLAGIKKAGDPTKMQTVPGNSPAASGSYLPANTQPAVGSNSTQGHNARMTPQTGVPPNYMNMMDVDSSNDSGSDNNAMASNEHSSERNQQQQQQQQQQQTARRLRNVFQERIKAQEARLHEVTLSVFSSFRRTLPYALLLAAKVHVDNIEWWAKEHQDDKMARAYLDLADIVRFLEIHQTSFSSTDYVSLVKGMMHVDIS